MIQTKGAEFTVHIQPEIISSEQARKRANGWLAMNVGHLLRSENPQLILTHQLELQWQVEVVLISPTGADLGQVGQLEIDGLTGDVLTSPTISEQIIAQADAFTGNQTLSSRS